MHPNEQTLEDFYAAFARLDASAMAKCYAEDVRFDDEVFSLRGRAEVAAMWRMLCEATQAKGRDAWRLQYSQIAATARHGQAHWEATYRFSATGRMVHNIIETEVGFNDAGLIDRQRDRFPFWHWASQALGTSGLLLGWTPILRAKVRKTAAANLRAFMTSRNIR